MTYQMQSERSQQEQSSSNGSSSSNSSNSTMIASSMGSQASPGTLTDILSMIVGGQMQDSMASAHNLANVARSHNDNATAQWAGKLWTIAKTFTEIQQIIDQETMSGVKDKAALIGQLGRALADSGTVAKGDVDRILKSAGGYWQLADKDEMESSSNGTGAAAVAQNSETVEQWRMPTDRPGAHCGIATSLMLLQANGKGDMGDVHQLVSEMYIYKKGTDVDKMADAMRKRGLENVTSTRSGRLSGLMDTLQKGQPVPFGITHCVGEVVKMNSTPSSGYSHYRPGDRHERSFPPAGHWVLVVGFEGTVENPTHFLFNDPDVGGQLRATTAELIKMGDGEGRFYQITQ